MERRNFIQQSLMAGAGFVTAKVPAGERQNRNPAEKTFNLYYAIHDGMFKNSAGPNFTDQIQFAYDKGFVP